MSLRPSELVPRARPFVPLLLAAAAAVAGLARGLGVALLVLAGGLLLLAIAALWRSVQSLDDDGDLSLDEALALAAPSAEEEKKRAVLRALKDLEYERSVGKVSEEDYATLSAQYRDEARRLLRALNERELPARQRVEELIAKRLEREAARRAERARSHEGPPEPAVDAEQATAGPDREAPRPAAEPGRDAPGPVGEADPDARQDARTTCASCGTRNETDARFCKHCGEALA